MTYAEMEKQIKLIEKDSNWLSPKDLATRVVVTDEYMSFPEDITIINHKDEWLYAFGATHTWRSADMETWELLA